MNPVFMNQTIRPPKQDRIGEGAYLMITETEMILRLMIAAGLGLIIGYERERQNQAAGLRTHMVLVTGSALAMIVSINLAVEYSGIATNGDPARLAAQVISGIGFLGVGAILRFGSNIKGLTTAASMWTMAVIGLSIGAGYFVAGVATTFILFVILAVVNVFEERMILTYATLHLIVDVDDRPGSVAQIRALLNGPKRNIKTFGLDKNLDQHTITIDAVLRIFQNETPEAIAEQLSSVEGIHRVKVSE
jgi:putative Mg2+ transporter-C (MgtC) family protein